MAKTEEKALSVPQNQLDLAKRLNASVGAVIGENKLLGFEKAFLIANAAKELKNALTAEFMEPIMALQNNRLGFKTDKDGSGYPLEVVKNCLIEAVLIGVQPFGNQFNIIAGNTYVTKEGFEYLLKNTPGLSFKIIPGLPRINPEKTSAAINVKIKYTFNGKENEEELDLPVKMNQYMGTDAVIGKATRKARAWLFNTINGTEVSDGDAQDVVAEVVETRVNTKKEKDDAVNKTGESLFGSGKKETV